MADMTNSDGGSPPSQGFVKVDLHIHTPFSQCYSETEVTPEQIVDAALAAGLAVIAITDHNTFQAIERVTGLAEARGLAVLPAVELSTVEGHLLAFFDPLAPLETLEALLRELGIPREMGGDAAAQASYPLEDVLRVIDELGGVAIAAHIERWPSGFLETKEHRSTKMRIHASPHLTALEITQPQSKRLWNQGLVRGYPKLYPCVQGSDAHAIEEIGRRFTYFRLSETGLEGFRLAFREHETRIAFPHEFIERDAASSGAGTARRL